MPVGSAWSFITDNESFSRARFRGVTWSKLTSNSQSFDVSRRRSVADVWFYRQADYAHGGIAADYCEDDPRPWVGNVFCTPRTTALHVQTAYLLHGGGVEELNLYQRTGTRRLKPTYWGDFPAAAGVATATARGTSDARWQLDDMLTHPILEPEHEFHNLDQQRLAVQALPFDAGIDINEDVRQFGWKVVLPDPVIVQINGEGHRIYDPPARRDDLGEEVQVKIMKRFHWINVGHITQYAEAWMVGVKIHELIEE